MRLLTKKELLVAKMKSLTSLIDQLEKLKVVPVISPPSVEAGLKLSEILLNNNLPVAEITFRTDCAAEAIRAIKQRYPDILLLAGTVLTGQQVDAALTAGAVAIVSPGFTPSLARYCQDKDVPFFPGVCTPSEIQMAVEAGITHLKFFPAALSGGVKMLSLFRDVYPHVRFMPTGGISMENIHEYLAVENVLCCGGTWLSPAAMMSDERWDEISKRVLAAVQHVNQ